MAKTKTSPKLSQGVLLPFEWDLVTEVKELCEKHGFEYGQGSMRFSNTEGRANFQFQIRRKLSKAEKQERNSREIVPGVRFRIKGTIYKVTGYLPRNRKYKVAAERDYDGCPFKVTRESVIDGWLED